MIPGGAGIKQPGLGTFSFVLVGGVWIQARDLRMGKDEKWDG